MATPGNQNGQQGAPQTTPPRWINFFIVFFLMTFILNMFAGSRAAANRTEIDYNQFINLVESGSVAQVQLEDEQILLTLSEDADRGVTAGILGTAPAGETSSRQSLTGQRSDKSSQVYYTGRIDDPDLVSRLNENGVSFYRKVEQTNPILSFMSSWIFPILIMYLIYYFFMRTMMKRMGGGEGGGLGGMMGVGKSKAKVYNLEKETGVTFADVAGQDEAKESLLEIVDFLHYPDKYHKIGAKQPKGALLVGPPGTGKTLLAKAVAGEAKVPFFSLSGSEFVEMFVGVGASRVRDLFAQANKQAPCIIFIDEIDAIGKSRDNQMGQNDEREQTLNQLLSEMDGFDSSKGIVVLAATNRPDSLDKALLRPGRFDRRVIVDKPDLPGRKSILQVHAARVSIGPDVELGEIAMATSGATGADLANMVNEAALRAVRMGRRAVMQEDLMEAVEVVIAGKEKRDRILTEKEKSMVAYHEIGHALASALQRNSQPVQKITIVPRTMGSLGYTMNMPEEERHLLTESELRAQITTLLAGRAAEEVVFGEASTGASNDIERATRMARSMVTQYGMSKTFGMMGLESTQNQYLDGRNVLTCSEATGATIDEEVRRIIEGCHDEAVTLIRKHEGKLHRLSEFLVERETITGAEFMDILKETEVSAS